MYGSGIGGESALSSWSILGSISAFGSPWNQDGTHHCNFIAEFCTLRPASLAIIPATLDTVALAAFATIPATPPTSKPYPEGLSPSECECMPTPIIWALTPKRVGFSVTSRFKAVTKEMKTFDPDSSES